MHTCSWMFRNTNKEFNGWVKQNHSQNYFEHLLCTSCTILNASFFCQLLVIKLDILASFHQGGKKEDDETNNALSCNFMVARADSEQVSKMAFFRVHLAGEAKRRFLFSLCAYCQMNLNMLLTKGTCILSGKLLVHFYTSAHVERENAQVFSCNSKGIQA